MSADTMGLAVIGSGSWGRNHVRSLATMPRVDLRWVCEKDEAAAERVRTNHPGVSVTGDLEQILADDSVRGVVVATPAPTHAAIGRAALEAGKDVLVEKPLAMGPEDAAELVRLADERGQILMVGHLLLHHPVVEALKALVDSGELGEILYLVCRRLNLGVVRQDENAWWSLAPHDLSIARYLLGAEPVAVSANGGTFLQTEAAIEDVVFGTVRFTGDRLAHVHVSWLDPHKTRMLTVVGSKKMAVFDDTSPDQKLKIYDKGVEPPKSLSYEEGVRVRTGDIRIPAIRMSEPLRREHEAFVRAIETREPPLGDGRSGLAVVRALEAGSRSLEAGGSEMKVQS